MLEFTPWCTIAALAAGVEHASDLADGGAQRHIGADPAFPIGE